MEILNKIQQELKASKGQRNTFGNYNYRSCEDILEAVKPLLDDATLIITDEIVCMGAPLPGTEKQTMKNGDIKTIEHSVDVGTRFYVKATATLTHNKESISVSAYAREPHNKKGMDEAQITGATSSYARKYALNGLFCIDDAKDADSTNTHGKDKKAVEKPPETNFFQLLVGRCGIEWITEKEVRSILKKVGVVNNEQLKNFTSEAAIKVIRENI